VIKLGVDQDALVKMFSEATARQGEALRKAVSDTTLKALHGRELTVDNIRRMLKMEEVFFSALSKAASGAGSALPAPWTQLLSQAQEALREGRMVRMRAAQAMLDSYAALVGGVLIGMSESLQAAAAPGAGRSRRE
jgi:hypothetical protein